MKIEVIRKNRSYLLVITCCDVKLIYIFKFNGYRLENH